MVLLVALTIVLSTMLLPSCGVLSRIAPSWTGWCPDNTQGKLHARLDQLAHERQDLETRISAYERRIALIQCQAQVSPPALPREVPQPDTPQPTQQDREIDRDAWQDRQIKVLDGCWNLSSNFSTVNSETGEKSVYRSWQMCFDADGNGQEIMRSDSGSVCQGPVTGRFQPDGSVLIREPSDLTCSDGGGLYRLESRCTLTGTGGASCRVTQPERGTQTTVEFRRAERGE